MQTSSRADLAIGKKLAEWISLFRLRWEESHVDGGFAAAMANVEEYRQMLLAYGGLQIERIKVLEVGFGARPLRMACMLGLGHDVYGIDLDQPVLTGSLREFWQILRKNGFERALKSSVRHYFFDVRERQRFARALADSGGQWRLPPERFFVGDIASSSIQKRLPGGFGLIYSEDVFEHISESKLVSTCSNLHALLVSEGICLIRLNPYTSIYGGHLVEWYHLDRRTEDNPRRSEPWEHLRRHRYSANTFLNCLRWNRYREIFQERFEVIAEIAAERPGARDYLTEEVRADLSEYSERELLTGNIMFVLRRRP